MNYSRLIDTLNIETTHLTSKVLHTNKKIAYVREYVRIWLQVSLNRSEVSNINFFDCMCNAGIYIDGDLSTASEVLLLFVEAAEKHQNKQFNLFVNDFDVKKIGICKQVFSALLQESSTPINLKIHISAEDVNDHLIGLSRFSDKLGFGASTVFFVDPYNLGTVKIDILSDIASKYYCEIIFNIFTNDFVRNKQQPKILNCIGDHDLHTKEELIENIRSRLQVGKMKYVLSYPFFISTNIELYQIFFVSPSEKGLDKVKEAYWNIFKGQTYHKNPSCAQGQGSLLSDENETTALLSYHAIAAQTRLTECFSGETVPYSEIRRFLAENSLLMESHNLYHVLKPLLESGRVDKCDLTKNKNNFKDDSYTFKEGHQ